MTGALALIACAAPDKIADPDGNRRVGVQVVFGVPGEVVTIP